MELYIEIRDGNMYGHPILYDNLKLIYHNIDEMISQGSYKKFITSDSSLIELNQYQVLDMFYEIQNDSVVQCWYARDLNEEEIKIKKIEFSQQYSDYISQEIKNAKNIISNLTNKDDIDLWNKYINALQNLEVNTLKPVLFPYKPYKNNEDKWISVDSSGSKPNVIE
jgi:hypothetical protein